MKSSKLGTTHPKGESMSSLPLDQHVGTSATVNLGPVVERTDIRSSLGPFRTLPDYITRYPEVVIQALGRLYAEYNAAFGPLVAQNREWETDYQPCFVEDAPVNWFVQIDMVGLPQPFLEEVADLPEAVVRELLRRRIFEIENSLAVYQLLERFFSRSGEDSFYKVRFRAALDGLRRRFGRPIALLAVTDQKYAAMRASEFGMLDGELLPDAEVSQLSGFDTFFGPDEFRRDLAASGGRCEHLLYIRSSDPLDRLKRPDLVVDQPLLGDPEIRRVIKSRALTFNVDAPEMGYERRINDTKGYMPHMGMAFPITSEDDLLSGAFEVYLWSQGINPEAVLSGKRAIRCKPAKGTYGCYGHLSGVLTDGRLRRELRRNLRLRGDYVVQPEMPASVITDGTDGTAYTYIDRNFFSMVDGRPMFLGGIRNLMPIDTSEVRKGRIHGNASAVYAEIVC
jgi:hypothetical protein